MNFPHLKQYPHIDEMYWWVDDQITRIRNEANATARDKPYAFEEFAKRSSARSRAARVYTYKRDGKDMDDNVHTLALQYVYPLQTIREAFDNDLPLAPNYATHCAKSMRRQIESVVLRDPLPGKTCLIDIANLARPHGIAGMAAANDLATDTLRKHVRVWSPDELEVVILEEFEQLAPTWERIESQYADGGPPYGLVTYCHARVVGPVILSKSAWQR